MLESLRPGLAFAQFVIGVALITAGCDGGRTAAGTGGSPNGGRGGDGTGGAGGAPDPAPIGPGIPTDGDVHCLAEMPAGPDLTFDYGRRCIIATKIGAPATDAEKTELCQRVGGTPITACPATDTPVAYCALASYGRPGVQTVPFQVVAVIELSPISPSAAAVVRDYASCDGGPIYDTANHHVTATCAGTLSASIDGVPVDFSTDIRCSFVSDGDRAMFQVSGSSSTDAWQPSLAVTVMKDETGFSLKPSVQYVEYPAGAAPLWFLTPVDATTLMYQSQIFDMMGAAMSGTFSLGAVQTDSGTARVISAGRVNVTFTVQ